MSPKSLDMLGAQELRPLPSAITGRTEVQLAFDVIRLGFVGMLGGAIAIAPLLVALLSLRRFPRWDQPRVFRVT
jgi:hypothetical protein